MKCLNYVFVATLLVFLKSTAEAANILAVAPTGSRSHFILQQPLYKELAASGHKITVISPFPNKTPIPNYTDVALNELIEYFESVKEDFTSSVEGSAASRVADIYNMGAEMSKMIAFGPEFQGLLKSNATFDLILLELSLDDFFIGLGHYYNAPIIGVSVIGAFKWINGYVGNPNPVSYIPNAFLPLTDKMTFFERLFNFLFTYYEEIFAEYVFHPKQELLYNKAFPDPKPSYSEARLNGVDFSFVNMHFSLTYGRPYVSNMIEVGGMHVNRKETPLPKDIQAFIDSAENGVIYFSLGSNVRPSVLGNEKRAAIVNTLLKRKEHIIWKWEGDLPEIAGRTNFLVSKWLPQDDILRHPKVKLFVTHGGLLSTTETVYHGVPIVGIPFFGDQDLNMAKADQAGFGKAVSFKTLTEEKLTNAIEEVLSDRKYLDTMKTVSKRFRDQPQHPLDTAKYWVEYVLRHKGAKHMRSTAMDLNWIQLYSFDTVGTIIGVIVFILFVIVLVIKKLLKYLFVKKGNKKLKRK